MGNIEKHNGHGSMMERSLFGAGRSARCLGKWGGGGRKSYVDWAETGN